MQDQTLVCRDCGKDFVWTAGEQEFYKQKGFDNKPSRCADCRKNKRTQVGGGGRFGGPRRQFEITCSECGAKDTVPFEPKDGRPVLCRNCFSKNRAQA